MAAKKITGAVLAEAFKKADDAARERQRLAEYWKEGADGGLPNFDDPMVYLPDIQEAVIRKAAKLAGIEISQNPIPRRGNWWILHVNPGTTEVTRTRCANAAVRFLVEVSGLRAHTWHKIDFKEWAAQEAPTPVPPEPPVDGRLPGF